MSFWVMSQLRITLTRNVFYSPMWEDQANKLGGRWMLTLQRSQKEEVNKLWLDTVLCLIGEAFDHSDEICGAVVNVRTKGDKICKSLIPPFCPLSVLTHASLSSCLDC